MSATILARFSGGPFDGRTAKAEAPAGLPPAELHMTVMDDAGNISTAAYRPAGRPDITGLATYTFDRQWSQVPQSIPEDDGPAPLDPELAAYLDWPLYFPDDSVSCYRQGHDCGDTFGPAYLASARRMTIREFLADVKAHAERQ